MTIKKKNKRAAMASTSQFHDPSARLSSEGGFSLVEVVIAMLITLVVILGVFQALTYAIAYNAGNKTRGQALAVMQQEVERLRSKKFTPGVTDPDLAGGTHTKSVTTNSGTVFQVDTVIDNDPTVEGVQDDTHQCLTPQNMAVPCTFKEIILTVQQVAPPPDWRSAVPARTVLRRTRGN